MAGAAEGEANTIIAGLERFVRLLILFCESLQFLAGLSGSIAGALSFAVVFLLFFCLYFFSVEGSVLWLCGGVGSAW